MIALNRRCSLRSFLKYMFAVYLTVVLFSLFNYNSRVVEADLQSLFDPTFTDMRGKCIPSFKNLNLRHDVDPYEKLAMVDVEKLYPSVKPGGIWSPEFCISIQTTTVLIPYRGRYKQLVVLLKRLHALLQKQLTTYQIVVVEQHGDEEFNRGMLFNVGAAELLKRYNATRMTSSAPPPYCFVFHDVDLLPEHDANLYYCDTSMRHMAAGINEQRYRPMYYEQMGGVCSLNRDNLLRINGFSNAYWGWGNEDDDFSARGREAGLILSRPPSRQARYKMIRHHKAWRTLRNVGMDLLMSWKERWETDGLSSLMQDAHSKKPYIVRSFTKFPLYSHLLVNIGKRPPPRRIENKKGFLWLIQFFYP